MKRAVNPIWRLDEAKAKWEAITGSAKVVLVTVKGHVKFSGLLTLDLEAPLTKVVEETK